MRRIAVLIVILLMFMSCSGSLDKVILWQLEGSKLYLNDYTSCNQVNDKSSKYDVYVSLKHRDNLKVNAIRLKVNVGELTDTIFIPLVDTTDCWIGTPYIGSYVVKTKFREDVSFNEMNNDSVFSVKPVMSEAIEGIDWLAIEFDAK